MLFVSSCVFYLFWSKGQSLPTLNKNKSANLQLNEQKGDTKVPFLSLIIDLEISAVISLFKPSNQVEGKADFYKKSFVLQAKKSRISANLVCFLLF